MAAAKKRIRVKGTDNGCTAVIRILSVHVYVYVHVHVYAYVYVYVHVHIYVYGYGEKVQITAVQPSSVSFTPALSTIPPVVSNPPKSLRYPLFIRGILSERNSHRRSPFTLGHHLPTVGAYSVT